jgi:hypothetical protein
MKTYLSIAIASILALGATGIANASPLFVTATIGGVPSVSGATLENFDGPSPSILTLSGSAYLTTVYPAFGYTPPYFSGSTAAYFGESPTIGYDASQYVAVETGGSATLNFSTPQKYLGLLWGSVDKSYNYLTFYDGANNVIGTVLGTDLTGVNDHDGGQNGTAYVNITSTTAFSKVVVNTSGAQGYYSFEFDDVAYAMVVPEPASGVLVGAGLCMLGLVLRRKSA